MVRQAGRPGAPLRPESRGALVPSPSRSRAPSLSARAPPPGPLGAARRPGWGRCGALGRWRLRRRRRTPHSVGPLSCPRLRATSLRAGGRPARTPNRPSRLGAALRPSAPPCGPRRRAPLRSAPLPSPRAAPLPPVRPLPAPRRSLPRSRLPRPAGRSAAGPFGLRSRSGCSPGPVPGRLRSGPAPAAPGVPARAGHLAPGSATGAGRGHRVLLSAPLASASRSHRCGGSRAARPRGSRWPCPLSLSPSSAVRRTP